MKAVILAGGLGKRLKPFSEVIPKPLLPIGEKSVLEIQIERLKKYNFNEVILCTGHKSGYIENFFGDGSRYGIKLIISKEEKPLGTVGPLTLIKDRLHDPFLMMNGDIISLIDFGKFYDFSVCQNSLLTIAIKKHVFPFAFGNIIFNGDHVIDIEEKPDIMKYIITGIYVIKPELLNIIPEDEYFGIDRLIKKMLEKKMPVIKYEISEYWLDIGQIEDYGQAQDDYLKHFNKDQ